MFCQPAWGAPENISINLGRCRVPVGPAGQGGDLPVSNSSRHWYAWRSAGNVRARAFGACRFPWKARYVHRTRLAATTMDGSLDTVRIRGLNSLIKTSEQAARNRALHQRSPFLGNGVAAQKLQRKVSRYGRRSCASGRHERWARKYTPGTGGTLLSASPEVAPPARGTGSYRDGGHDGQTGGWTGGQG